MKIPKIEQLPSGNWFCRLRLNGVSIPITAETQTECERLAYLRKSEYLAGAFRIQKTPKETTLQEAINKYIAVSRTTISPATERSYLCYAKARFPKYKDKKLSEIKWQRMIDDELQMVSEKTVKNAWFLVKPALENIGFPVPDVRLAQPVVPDLNFLQPEEIKPFCAAVKGRNYEIAALLMLHGLRMSEVRGLDWKNVDLKNDVISIKGANVRGPQGNVDKKTNKNDTSTRTVPIMIPQLHDALNGCKDKTGRVVTTGAGTLLDDVKRACNRAGVTECTPHDLRRSFASLCFFLGIPLKQIKEWGGWKNDDVLNRVYIKLSNTMRTDSKDKFQQFFIGK